MKKLFPLSLLVSLAAAQVSADDGFLTDQEKIYQLQKDQNKKITSKILGNPNRLKSLASVKSASDFFINPIYLRNIVLYSHKDYLNLISHNECTFYSLLATNILKTSDGTIQNVVVDVKNELGNYVTTIVPREEFLATVAKFKCQKELSNIKKFTNAKIVETLKGINFEIPTNRSQCSNIWKNFKKSTELPYICNIPETIKLGKQSEKYIGSDKFDFQKQRKIREVVASKDFYIKNIDISIRTYADNLCQNIHHEEEFCNFYLRNDIWTKTVKEGTEAYKMSYHCDRYFNKTSDPFVQFKKCRDLLTRKPNTCATSISKTLTALYPRTDCDEISDILNISHLKTPYQDNPGFVENEAIINSVRILNHFNPDQKRSFDTNVAFAQTAIMTDNKKAWPLEICYYDRLDAKENCLPFVPQTATDSSLSETKVITKILARTVGADESKPCEFTPEYQYQPEILKYKTGCHILFNPKNCTSFYCPKKIKYNGKDVEGLKYRGTPIFDYFVNDASTSKYTIATTLDEKFKVRPTLLMNLTEINFFLNQSKETIIHGIGCGEELIPSTFRKRTLNQCTPIPFIIDGMRKNKFNRDEVILRMAIDDVHHPRFIDWKRVFNAVSSYRNIHPHKLWALYGLKK